jgi:nucleotide-binding universal stress UspA family protein
MTRPVLKSILVPLDFSPQSEAALREAIHLAEKTGAQVHVLHVFSLQERRETDLTNAGLEQAADDERQHLQASADQVKKSANLGEILWRAGDPAPQILIVAKDIEADLIVLGASGRSGFKRFILGSVAEAVCRDASCNVFVVRRQSGTAQPEITQEDPKSSTSQPPPTPQADLRSVSTAASSAVGLNPKPRKILLPYDFSTYSESVLQVAADLSRRYDASVTVLHIWQPEAIEIPEDFPVNTDQKLELYRQHLTTRLEAARTWLQEAAVQQVDISLVMGAPASEIVRVAQEGHYDFIVMGTHGRTGLAHVLLGSVAEGVIRRAPSAVVTVRLNSALAVPPTFTTQAVIEGFV